LHSFGDNKEKMGRMEITTLRPPCKKKEKGKGGGEKGHTVHALQMAASDDKEKKKRGGEGRSKNHAGPALEGGKKRSSPCNGFQGKKKGKEKKTRLF